jgi:hypothetical protein
LLADPPLWASQALGEPPLSGPDRRRWAERATQLASYRETHDIVDQADALGPRPDDQVKRCAWDLAQLALLDHQRSLEMDRGLAL